MIHNYSTCVHEKGRRMSYENQRKRQTSTGWAEVKEISRCCTRSCCDSSRHKILDSNWAKAKWWHCCKAAGSNLWKIFYSLQFFCNVEREWALVYWIQCALFSPTLYQMGNQSRDRCHGKCKRSVIFGPNSQLALLWSAFQSKTRPSSSIFPPHASNRQPVIR